MISLWHLHGFSNTHANGYACSVQTAKDDTAYTQVSNQVEDSPENRANQPLKNGSYIAMSPVEAQKCWWRWLVESHLRTSRLSSSLFLYVSFHCAICLRGQSPHAHHRLPRVTYLTRDFFVSLSMAFQTAISSIKTCKLKAPTSVSNNRLWVSRGFCCLVLRGLKHTLLPFENTYMHCMLTESIVPVGS